MLALKSNTKLRFFFQDIKFNLENRTALKKYIDTIFVKERRQLQSLNYIFCTDRALLEINRQFLDHDFFTDIITFDLSTSNQIVAEIYISIDRVRDNAKSLNVSFKSEIHRVIFHGALHLCGYKDKTKAEKTNMRYKEDFYVGKYLR